MKQKAIIIEFVGPPGAGKTSSCKYFACHLKNRGLSISTLQDLKDFTRNMNVFERFFLLSKAFIFRGHTLLFFSAALAYNKIYSLNSIYRYVRLTLFDLSLKQFLKNRNIDIILLDQWAIQELWSATIFKLKSYDRIKDQLSKFYFKTDLVLYFEIDEVTASERIKKRNTNFSRFDKLDDDKRSAEILKYSNYLFELYNNSACTNKHVFSGKQSLENNSAFFSEYLEHGFKNTLYSVA